MNSSHGYSSFLEPDILAGHRNTSFKEAASEPWLWGQTEQCRDLFSWEAYKDQPGGLQVPTAPQGGDWGKGLDNTVSRAGMDQSQSSLAGPLETQTALPL